MTPRDELYISLPQRDLESVAVLLVLAIMALIAIVLYSTWPEWRR